MSTSRLLLLSCGLSLAALPSYVMGVEVRLSESRSDTVAISSNNPPRDSSSPEAVTLNALGSANAVAAAAAGEDKTSPQAVCTAWKFRVEQAMVNQVFGFGTEETYAQIRRLAALNGDYYYLTGAEDAIGQITHRAFNRYNWRNIANLEEWEDAVNEIKNDTYRDCLGQMFRKQDFWAIDERARTLID